MNLDKFIRFTECATKTELEKVELIMFYQLKVGKINETSLNDIGDMLFKCGFSRPNISRLKSKIINSKNFVKGGKSDFYRLNRLKIHEFEKKYPELEEKSEEIISDDIVIPETLYQGTRGYIVLLSKQINACYEHNLFDGCAILMRRLIEILIIQVYEHLGRISEIEEDQQYKSLATIINYTLSNNVINWSKETSEIIDDFRILGNLSAHKIQYNTKKIEISRIRIKFRVAVEELLYASAIKK